MPKGSLVFLSAKAGMSLVERTCVFGQFRSSPSWSSVLVNQHCTPNRVSVNRNTHQTRVCINWLMKKSWPEVHRILSRYFRWGQQVSIRACRVCVSFMGHRCYCWEQWRRLQAPGIGRVTKCRVRLQRSRWWERLKSVFRKLMVRRSYTA